MISLSSIKGNATEASNYYLKEEKEAEMSQVALTLSPEKSGQSASDYYLAQKENPEATQWFGQLAKDAGLHGKPITDSQLNQVLAGRLGNETVPRAGTEHRRMGYDLTFSAPKGVSIMALVYGDTRIVEAHQQAVKTVCQEIEKHTAQVVLTQDKYRTFENTHNLLFGLVQHQTSREDEPQLHTHTLMANMTRDSQGNIKNLASQRRQEELVKQGTFERILHDQKYYSALYHSTLGVALKEMGYQVKSMGNGQIDIADVPESVIQANSTRREQILQHTQEHNLDSGKARDIAAKATRKAKTYQEAQGLQAKWQDTNQALGFDGQALVHRTLMQAGQTPPTPATPDITPDIKHSVEMALAHAARQQTKLGFHHVVSLAMGEFSQNKVHDIAAVKAYLQQGIEQGRLLPLTDNASHFTTLKAIGQEQSLIQTAQVKRKGLNTRLNDTALHQLNLSEGGQKTVSKLMQSKTTAHVLDITGSSQSVVNHLLHVGRESGHPMTLLAPDFLTQRSAQSALKRPTFTALQWLKNLFAQDTAQSVHQALQEGHDLPDKGTVLVEQANTLSLDATQKLLDKAHQSHTKVIFLNHLNKRQAFGAGNAMETLKRAKVAQFEWHQERHTDTQVRIETHSNQLDIEQVALQYAELSPQARAHTQVLAASKKDAHTLNQTLRGAMERTGQLGEQRLTIATLSPTYLTPEQQGNASSFKKGMIMTEFVDNKPIVHTVLEVDKARNRLHLQTGNQASHWVDAPRAQFATRNMQYALPSQLELAQGDKVLASKSVFRTPIQKGQRFTVEALSERALTLRDDNTDRTYRVPTEHLQHASLDHAFASSLNQRAPNMHHLWFVGKSYQASANVLNELLDNQSQSVTFITNDGDKLKGKLAQSTTRPSSIHSVVQSARQTVQSQTPNDKTLQAATLKAVTHDVTQAMRTLTQAHQPKGVIEQAALAAVSHITEKQAAMRHVDLVKTAMGFALEEAQTPITQEAIDHQFTKLQQQGTLLSVAYSDGTRWVTQDALDCEARILSQFTQGQNTQSPLVSNPSAIQAFLKDKGNTAGQNDALTHILTSPDRFIAIQGFAGTGKSTMLKQAIALTQAHHPEAQFQGLAPTHAAVNELKDKGVPAQTIQSFLQAMRTQESTPEQYQGTVFLVDESSMLSNRQMDTLTDTLSQIGARAVLLGDKVQLQSQESGKPFELGIRHQALKVTVMKDIVRQNQDSVKTAVEHIIDHETASTVASLERQPIPDLKPEGSEHEPPPAVISTYEKTHQDEKVNQEQARQKIYTTAAEEYLSRTEYARDNTLLIAYSNQERDQVTELIREGLQKEGSLDTQDVLVSRLKSLGLTREQMTMTHSYKKDDIFTSKNGDYHRITSVDHRHKLVTLANIHTGEVSTLFPAKAHHQYTGLWHESAPPLALNDKIMWRKSEPERQLMGNEPLTVTGLEGGMLTVKSEHTGKTHQLDMSDMKNSHWDYRYTRTADMAQGATYPNVISLIRSNAKLTNIRRAYIDISRASDHMMIITDDIKATMLSWINHDKGSLSAIETLERTPLDKEKVFNNTMDKYDNPEFRHPDGRFSLTRYAKHVNEQLLPYTESLAVHYLGQANRSKSNKDYLSFGVGKSLTKVSLTGEYRGFYKNWDTGERGNLINLIKDLDDIPFKDAVEKAEAMLSDPEAHHLTANPHSDDLKAALPEKLSKLKAYAEHYDKTSQPIQGTLAETYLQRQGIETQALSAVRFHDSVYSSESKQTHPAMIATYTDKEKNTQAIEITYLKENGERAELDIDKRILGNKSKHLIEIQDRNTLYPALIIEGTESALTLSQDVSRQYSIYSVDNLNHLKSLDTNIIDNQHLIIVHSDKLSPEVMDDIKLGLSEKGKHVESIDENQLNQLTQHHEPHQELPEHQKVELDKEKDILPSEKDMDLLFNDKEKSMNIDIDKERDIHSHPSPDHNKDSDIQFDELSL